MGLSRKVWMGVCCSWGEGECGVLASSQRSWGFSFLGPFERTFKRRNVEKNDIRLWKRTRKKFILWKVTAMFSK